MNGHKSILFAELRMQSAAIAQCGGCSMIMVGVDVGGTFTDLVPANMQTAQQVIHKMPTTPHDPSVGVLQGVVELCALAGVNPGEVRYFLHGTTTATNAVLEHKGAKTGLITNVGFRNILHIARHQRVEHFSILQDLPWRARPLPSPPPSRWPPHLPPLCPPPRHRLPQSPQRQAHRSCRRLQLLQH